MAKVNNKIPQSPWPWGGAPSVRERLVDPAQLERRKAKAGNPKSPALASAALLDFIGPAHSSEELRLPLPAFPEGHDADVETFLDRPYLLSVAERGEPDAQQVLERGLGRIQVSPERLDRMRALLDREGEMLSTVDGVAQQMREILRRMWEAQKDENF